MAKGIAFPKLKLVSSPTAEQLAKMMPEEHFAAVFDSGVEPTFTVSGDHFPYPVTLTLGRDRHGQLAVTRLVIDVGAAGGAGISSTGLRDVGAGIGALLRSIAEHRLDEGSAALLGPLLNDAALPYAGVAIRPGRRGHSAEYFRDVAEGFRAALDENPRLPYLALAPKLFVSEVQTRRLVKRAFEMYPELRPCGAGEEEGES